MKSSPSITTPRLMLYTALALLASVVTGLTFAAWFNNSDSIFLSLINAGLAWCM